MAKNYQHIFTLECLFGKKNQKNKITNHQSNQVMFVQIRDTNCRTVFAMEYNANEWIPKGSYMYFHCLNEVGLSKIFYFVNAEK
jgi:hypothetical protein